MLTRRSLFGALAALPVVGKLVEGRGEGQLDGWSNREDAFACCGGEDWARYAQEWKRRHNLAWKQAMEGAERVLWTLPEEGAVIKQGDPWPWRRIK